MSTATLAGRRVTHARANIPAWGCWFAEVSIDGEHSLTGFLDLKIADLTLKGTVLSGGPSKGRSDFRIVGGKGGWGREIPKKSYANGAEIKASKILNDAAQAAGESIVATTATNKVGPHFVRPAGRASLVLEQLAPNGWYVDESGVTQIGTRASSTLNTAVPRVSPVDKARGTITLAPTAIATILPGVVVDGLTAVDVVHEVNPSVGLRSTIWGKQASEASERLAAYRAIVDALDPNRKFRGTFEYRVLSQSGERLNLAPVRVSTGMPELQRVYVRPGVAGCRSTLAPGARVLVTFIDADPGRPVVIGFDDADGDGFLPLLTEIDATTFVNIADGARLLPATGDLAGGIWPIVGTTRIKG